jgi:hypothetical protein
MKWNQWRKQNNRPETLRYSVISDIKNIVADGETDLRKAAVVKNPIGDSVRAIKKLSGEYSVVEINGKSNQIDLSDINVETLIAILNRLEVDSMDKYFNYPACCVEFFESGKSYNAHDVNWGGFIPCMEHKDFSLEEITKLLGRNPVTADKDDEGYLLWGRELEPQTIYEDDYKDYGIEIDDNLDGTFGIYCRVVNEEGDVMDSIGDSSLRFFTQAEALQYAKNFVDNYKG